MTWYILKNHANRPVIVKYGINTMGNGDDGGLSELLSDGGLDELVCVQVHSCGSLIKDQDSGRLQ